MGSNSIKGEDFSVELVESGPQVAFSGTIRLQSNDDYVPILELMQRGLELGKGAELELDLRGLQFLNSSGINTISKFVISARKLDQTGLKVRGNKDIYWQQKSLANLQKLWPKVAIEIE